MAAFLKIVSVIYLVAIWLVIAVAFFVLQAPSSLWGTAGQTLAVLSGVVLSIPAVALYAFGRIVDDVRQMRNHLAAMRRFYEPDRS